MVNSARRSSSMKSSSLSSSATPVTASGKRALRYATAYAAHGGERPLKMRALDSFAPAAKLLTSSSSLRRNSRSSDRSEKPSTDASGAAAAAAHEAGTSVHSTTAARAAGATAVQCPALLATESSSPPHPLTSATLQFLQERCPTAPRRISSEALRLVRCVTSADGAPSRLPTSVSTACGSPAAATVFRRLLLKDASLPQIADSLALSSLEHSFATRGQSVLLVVVEPTAATVEALRLRIATTYAIPTIVVDDTSKAPCTLHVPLTPESELGMRAAPMVLATPAGLGRLSQPSNLWDCCGAVVVLTSAALEAFVSQRTAMVVDEASSPLTAKFRGKALRGVVLLSSSIDMLSAPLWRKWLLTGPCSTDENTQRTNQQDADSGAIETAGKSRTTEATAAQQQQQHSSSSTAEPLCVHHMTVEGLPRFQCVYGMLMGHASRCHHPMDGAAAAVVVVVVHFATSESASLWYDVLLALQEFPEATTTVLCDSDLVKSRSPSAPLGDATGADHEMLQLSAVHVKLNADVNKALTSAGASGHHHGACVIVLSCSAFIPSYGALQCCAPVADAPRCGSAKQASRSEARTTVDVVLVQYDAMLSIATYSAFLAKARRHCCCVGDGHDELRASDAVPKTSKKGKASRNDGGTTVVRFHPLVLLRRNEAPAALSILQASGEAHGVRYVAQPRPPSATVAYLSAQKFMSLHKKVFAIHLKAFEAYRATMQVYSRLRPTEVYRVSEQRDGLNLDLVGAEFGYTEIPLLDLRTKSTSFRPREDVAKVAKQRLVREQRAKRKFADEHLVGEGPDEDPFHEKEARLEEQPVMVAEAPAVEQKKPLGKGTKKRNKTS